MINRQRFSRLTIGCCLALTPSFAAPVFGPGTSLNIDTCGSGNAYTGSIHANPVNGGAGVILSGNASVTATGTLCLQMNWVGSMSGSVDSVTDIPFAWDFTVGVTDLTAPVMSTFVSIEIDHEPYFVGGFNQGGYMYSTSYNGPGQITTPGGYSLNWPGPHPGTSRQFTTYRAGITVVYENIGQSVETLTLDVPANTSIDIGNFQGGGGPTSAPEPSTWGLIGAGLAGIAWRKRTRA